MITRDPVDPIEPLLDALVDGLDELGVSHLRGHPDPNQAAFELLAFRRALDHFRSGSLRELRRVFSRPGTFVLH